MYSLTIHFGPHAICWAFLFKDKDKAAHELDVAQKAIVDGEAAAISDEFGQIASFAAGTLSGALLENLDLAEAARIQRSLAEERCKVRLMVAAKADPVIGEAIRRQGAPVLTPMGGRFPQ